MKNDWIICGWYTPDYQAFADKFKASLLNSNCPFDLTQVEKKPGGWEKNTLRKPEMVRLFLTRHPHKTIILSDVDAQVMGSLDEAADIDCDVALKLAAKNKRGHIFIVPRSGTMIIKPTPTTLQLVENWERRCATSVYGRTDESCLAEAIEDTPGLRLVALGGELYDLIRHDWASRNVTKASNLKRMLRKMKVTP